MEATEHQGHNVHAKAWDEIPQSTLQASWNKLLREGGTSVAEPSVVPEMVEALESIPGCGDCDEADVTEWVGMDSDDQGYEILGEDEIIQAVTETDICDSVEDDSGDELELPLPSHGEVMNMLNQCLPWVEIQPETTPTHNNYLQKPNGNGSNKEKFKFKAVKDNKILYLVHVHGIVRMHAFLILCCCSKVMTDSTYTLILRTHASQISSDNRGSAVVHGLYENKM